MAQSNIGGFSSKPKCCTRDNSTVYVEIYGRVIFDSDGRPVMLQGTTRNITKRKQAEEKLRQTKYMLTEAQRVARLGSWQWDIAANKVTWSDAMFSVFGLEPQEVTYDLLKSLIHPEDVDWWEKCLNKMLVNSDAAFDIDYRIIRPDGKVAWIHNEAEVHRDNDGKPVAMFAISQDITERKYMEEQLSHAQKLDAVGQLAGGVAHDFNNMLMGIMGYTDLCRDSIEEGHPICEWLDEVIKISLHSAEIVRQLLAFSRKQTIAPKVLNLNDTVGNMLKMLHRLIGEDINLIWQPGADLRLINIDPSQVDQILANLCVNARDAIGGVGKITIETANVTLDSDSLVHTDVIPGDYVMLAITDNGCGMDAEIQGSIFDPFFTTKPVGQGTGLGLATVYGIVKQNEGYIHLYSELGQGTTFRLYFPCKEGTANDDHRKEEFTEIPGGSETILVVEDEEAIRRTISIFLGKLGYIVYKAENPKKALEIFNEHGIAFDVLITDVVMPGMNGRELAEKLLSKHPILKVLYVSGYTANVIAHKGILDAGVEFLSKPVTGETLARKLRSMLDE